jgi:hypothetical protein
MKAVFSGQPAPVAGLYELVDGPAGWTGIQQHFEQGETTTTPLPEGQRWVWLKPFMELPITSSQ